MFVYSLKERCQLSLFAFRLSASPALCDQLFRSHERRELLLRRVGFPENSRMQPAQQ